MDHRWADGLGEELVQPPNGATKPPSEEVMLKAMLDLERAPASKLSMLPIKVLKRLCEEKDVLPPVRREQNNRTVLLRHLKDYVRFLVFPLSHVTALTQHSASTVDGLQLRIKNSHLRARRPVSL